MKIQIKFRKPEYKCYQPKQRREENCTGRYSRGLRNQNGDYLRNICESNILKRKRISQTFCLAESKYNVKIKITHKVVGDGCIWEVLSLMNVC